MVAICTDGMSNGVMGWNDRGEIAKDKRADLIMLDENLNVQKVILKGEII